MTFHIDQITATRFLHGNARYRKRDREHVEVGGMDIGRLMLSNLSNLKKLILRCGSKTDIIFGAYLPNVEEVTIENGPHNSFHASVSTLEAIYLFSLPRLRKLRIASPVTVRTAEHRVILLRQLSTSTVTNMHLMLEATSGPDFLLLVHAPKQLQRLDVSRYPGSNCRPEVPGRVLSTAKLFFVHWSITRGAWKRSRSLAGNWNAAVAMTRLKRSVISRVSNNSLLIHNFSTTPRAHRLTYGLSHTFFRHL
jgi:hypothetical protein